MTPKCDMVVKKCNLTLTMSPTCHSNNTIDLYEGTANTDESSAVALLVLFYSSAPSGGERNVTVVKFQTPSYSAFRDMNFFQSDFSYSPDRQTDRQKVTHMSPPCNMHRWAQKLILSGLISRDFLDSLTIIILSRASGAGSPCQVWRPSVNKRRSSFHTNVATDITHDMCTEGFLKLRETMQKGAPTLRCFHKIISLPGKKCSGSTALLMIFGEFGAEKSSSWTPVLSDIMNMKHISKPQGLVIH